MKKDRRTGGFALSSSGLTPLRFSYDTKENL